MDKPRAITGFNDILPTEAALWMRMETSARDIFARYGYLEIRVPMLEFTPIFSRGIGEGTQVVQKEMYTFDDRGGDSVTLRPEGTAGVVRAYVEHALQAQEEITKLFYMGPMFRYERPQKGRLRQFHQIGAEILGIDSPLADAEIVIIIDRLAKALGVTGFEIQINTLGTIEERAPYLEKLVAYFRGHEESLCADCRDRLTRNPLRIFDCKNPHCHDVGKSAPLLMDQLGDASRAHFEAFRAELTRAGTAHTVNPRIVRGLDYYEKTTFEVTSQQLGSQSAFAAGGRYNKLVEELGGKPTPGTGFAIGCERLILLMQEAAPKQVEQPLNGVYIAALSDAALSKARELLQKLRDAGAHAEAGYEVKSLKSQMRRADKHKFRHVLMLGENELATGTVIVKDLADGSQREIPLGDVVGELASSRS